MNQSLPACLINHYRLPSRYRAYLVMRIPMTILALLPYQMLLFYCQNNMVSAEPKPKRDR